MSKISKWIKDYCFSIIGFLFIIASVAFMFYELYCPGFLYNLGWEKLAQKGDFIGGHLAAFFTLAAFLLMIDTLKLQRKDINMQSKELKESRRASIEQNMFNLVTAANELHRQILSFPDRNAPSVIQSYSNILEVFCKRYTAYKKRYELEQEDIDVLDSLAKSIYIKTFMERTEFMELPNYEENMKLFNLLHPKK